MQVDDPAGEAALVEELEPDAHVAGQPMGTAAHHHGGDEQVKLVHEPGPERLSGEPRATDADVGPGLALSRLTASGSNSRSRRVRAVVGSASVRE